MPRLYTTLGPLEADKVGMILPHEHIFVDLRTPDIPEQGQADIADVQRLMAPQVRLARAAGVSALVDSGPVGVGRRSDAILAVSQLTAFPILIPTGVYREPWIPDWIKSAPVEELEMWMTSELEEQIEDTGVKAGWIKLSAGDDGLTPTEIKILRAAARAGKHTGAVIGSHTHTGPSCKRSARYHRARRLQPRALYLDSRSQRGQSRPCGKDRPPWNMDRV